MYKRNLPLVLTCLLLMLTAAGCGKDQVDQAELTLRNTGVFDSKAVDKVNKVEWEFQTEGGGPILGPTLGSQAIFLSNGENFYAVDKETGNQVWSTSAEGEVSLAAESQGIVCFTDDNNLYAYNAEDGRLLWKRAFQDTISILHRAVTAVIKDKVILVENEKLYGLDLKTGEEQWENDEVAFSDISGTPYDDGKIVLATEDTILAVDLADGKIKDKIKHTNGGDQKQLLVIEDKLIVADVLGGISVYNVDNGELQWKNEETLVTAVAYYDGMLFSTNMIDGKVYAMEFASGHVVWDKQIANPELGMLRINSSGEIEQNKDGKIQFINSPISIADGTLYLGAWNTTHGEIIALDSKTGNINWSYEPHTDLSTSPFLIANQKLYGLNTEHSLAAFSGN